MAIGSNIQTLLARPTIKFGDHPTNYIIIPESGFVTVWLDTIYNTDTYLVKIFIDLNYTKVSDYQWVIEGDIVGFNYVYMSITDIATSQEVYSNTLIIIVE